MKAATLSEGELVWHGEYPPSVVERVRADIALCLDEDLDDPSELCFHTVFLTDDMDGAIVVVWGEVGSPALHCEYHGNAQWVPISELDED